MFMTCYQWMQWTKKSLAVAVVIVFLFTVFCSSPASATHISHTPDDVYSRVLVLEQLLNTYRLQKGITEPWASAPEQHGKAPRHVYQKGLEVLDKISRLRKIERMGGITVPYYPSREIEPNETFALVDRLADEMSLLLATPPDITTRAVSGKSPNDVYRKLWQISKALDPAIGIKGLHPTDVYAQSLIVLDIVRFLRVSQNLPLNTKKPEPSTGKHPNHALAASYELLNKIAMAERNLWMEPVEHKTVPRRVIKPEEVYDSLLNIRAELHRIQYRIGVERYFPLPKVKNEKSPDDVIDNLRLAALLLPDFPVDRPLVQNDRASLQKKPADVYALTAHIIDQLLKYRNIRGIRTAIRPVSPQQNKMPRHVYQKTLECLEKVNRIRQLTGLGAMALPRHPLRDITPTEVYEQSVRLDEELDLIVTLAGMSVTNARFESGGSQFNDKTPSDVYANMWQISHLLDTIIGDAGFRLPDIIVKTENLLADIVLIRTKLSMPPKTDKPPLIAGISASAVFALAAETRAVLSRVIQRAGLVHIRNIGEGSHNATTAEELFNEIILIQAEVIALKTSLGVTGYPPAIEKQDSATLSDIYQHIQWVNEMLEDMLTAPGQN